MHIGKKKFLLTLLFGILLLPLPSFAQQNFLLQMPTISLASLPLSLTNAISSIINMLLYFVGTIAVAFLIIAGFQFILSAGNPDGVQRAKAAALNTIFGLVIIILSSAAVKFILTTVAH